MHIVLKNSSCWNEMWKMHMKYKVWISLTRNYAESHCSKILIFSGFQSNAEKFLIYTLTLVLTSLSAVAVCFAVSSSTKVFAIASLLTVLPYIFMMVRIVCLFRERLLTPLSIKLRLRLRDVCYNRFYSFYTCSEFHLVLPFT